MSRVAPVLVFFLALPALAAQPLLRPDQSLGPIVSAPTFLGPASACATDGTNFFVVGHGGSRVIGTRIAPGGAHLDSPSITIADGLTAYSDTMGAAVAYTGGQYVVAYGDISSIATARVDNDGRLLDAQPATVSGPAARLRLAWSGRVLLMVANGTRMRLLDRDGKPLAPDRPLPVALKPETVDVASNGDGFVITGAGLDSKLELIRVDERGGATAMAGPLNGLPSSTAIASDGYDYLIAATTVNGTTLFSLLADGTLRGAVTADTFFGIDAALAWNGSDYALAVTRVVLEGEGGYETVVSRFGANGISAVATIPGTTSPLLQSNGHEFLLVASRQVLRYMAQIEGRIFDAQNAVKVIGVSNGPAAQSGVAIAANRTRALAVWQEGPSFTEQHVLAAIADDLGALGAPVEISGDAFPVSSLAAASDGRDFIVAWRSSSGAILARRVTADGAVLDAAPIVAGDTPTDSYTTIAAMWSGRRYVVAWTNANNRLAITAISPDGVHVSGAPVEVSAVSSEIAGGAAVACNGTHCVIGFTGVTPYVMEQPPSGGVYALRLTADGTPAGGVTSLVRDPSAYAVKVMLRGSDATVFHGSDSVMYASSLAGGTSRAVISGGPGERPHPVAVVDDGLYWTTNTGLLRWSRPDAAGNIGSFVDVDATDPAALTVTSRALLLARWVYAPPFGWRLYLRTLARPDVPAPSLPSRRRVAR